MYVYRQNLFNQFDQLLRHPEDRQALKKLEYLFGRSEESLVELINGFGRLLISHKSRPSFTQDAPTVALLRRIQVDLQGLDRVLTPPLANRVLACVMRWQNPLTAACKQSQQFAQDSIASICQSQATYEAWLSSADAKDPQKTSAFVESLKTDPQKLILFFETAITFPLWTMENEEILSDCCEQLARFAANHRITAKQAKDLVTLSRQPLLEQISNLKCVVAEESHLLNKILFATKCPDFEALFGEGRVDAITLNPEITREAFLHVLRYFETDQLPQVSQETWRQIVQALDFLGVSVRAMLLTARKQYASCLSVHCLPDDRYKVALKDPVDQKALDLLGMEPLNWHVTEVELSSCQVTDAFLSAVMKAFPNVRNLALPFPNPLSDEGWKALDDLRALTKLVLSIESCKALKGDFPEHLKQTKQYQLVLQSSFPFSNDELKLLASHPIRQDLAEYPQRLTYNAEPPSLAALQQFPQLISLDLSLFGMTTKPVTETYLTGLKQACPQLLRLSLSGCKMISFPGFQELVRSSQLTDFDLSATPVTDASVTYLVQNCKGLREVRLQSCESITDNALAALATCRTLKSLHLGNCPNVSEKAARYLLHECRYRLHELTLPQSMVNGPTLRAVAKEHPTLVKLFLRADANHRHNVTDEDVLALVDQCQNLTELDLSHGFITDQAIIALADRCPWLEKLYLNNCPNITPSSLYYLLSKCPNMRELCLRDSRGIDEDTACSLARNYPHVTIYEPVPTQSMSRAMEQPRNLR